MQVPSATAAKLFLCLVQARHGFNRTTVKTFCNDIVKTVRSCPVLSMQMCTWSVDLLRKLHNYASHRQQ